MTNYEPTDDDRWVRAEALREAADYFAATGSHRHLSWSDVADVLRRRAEQIGADDE
jgi:DNA primase catalytic subunit